LRGGGKREGLYRLATFDQEQGKPMRRSILGREEEHLFTWISSKKDGHYHAGLKEEEKKGTLFIEEDHLPPRQKDIQEKRRGKIVRD